MIRLSETASLFHADCRDAIKLQAHNSLDSCVTDPPYALVSTLKRFTNSPCTEASMPTAGPYARASRGFMGQTWDTGETAFSTEFWTEVYRVLKPGAFVAAFGSSRGYHRMACAIEDAGFEIRDSLMWIYGTGFPKSHDVSKGIDKDLPGGAPLSPEAAQWEGWGTALKPAFEPIVLARKPLSEGTVAANVLKWGTGAINIDGCRVPSAAGDAPVSWESPRGGIWRTDAAAHAQLVTTGQGRFPANVVTDGSDEVVGAFPSTRARGNVTPTKRQQSEGVWAEHGARFGVGQDGPIDAGDSGSAARFFYSAKASKADRNGSKHPTVKPIALMEWLATLVTPPGGTILDPFAGSGTTGAAARNKGFNIIMCERESKYVADIKARFGFVNSPPLAPLAPLPAMSPPPY